MSPVLRFACLFWIAALAGAPAARAAETWTVQGRTYENVRVREVTPATVTIFHRGGVLQLELAKLPPELQARFRFDPSRAAEWERETETAARRDLEARRVRSAAHAAAQTAALEGADAAGAPRPATGDRLDVQLQAAVDLRPMYQKHGLFLKDQGRRPSCSVFAVVSALEYEIARRQGAAEPLSEEFLIWAVRALQPGIPIDDGYHFEEVVAALQTYGIPRQATMPNTFGVSTAEIRPNVEAMAEAALRRQAVPRWFRRDDPQLIERIVDSLNRGTPVVVGVRWPHWRTLERNNLLRDQAPLEGAGHAVTIIGYRCPSGNIGETTFLFRNSYGVAWGMGGCAFMATSYLRENLIAAFHLTLPEPAPALAGR